MARPVNCKSCRHVKTQCTCGRPTEYKEEYVDKVDEYLLLCTDEVEEYHKTRGEKSDTYERLVNVKLPKIEGFAQFLDVDKTSLYEWEKKHKTFSHALNKIRTAQHNRLVDNGLAGVYSPVITKLMLSNNHGYKEKADVTTNNKDLPQPILLNAFPNNDSNTEGSQA